jgi:hypothetical protein
LLNVQPDYDYAAQAEALRKTVPDWSHIRGTFDEDFRLRAKDGKTVALLLRNVIPEKLHQRAFAGWWDRVTQRVTDRVDVLGTVSLPKKMRRDGSPSGVYGVNKGILDATPAGEARQATLGCSAHGITPITKKYPQMLNDNRELIELVDQLFKKHLPHVREQARTEIKRAPEEFRLWKTAFTSVYLFKAWSSRYHKDKNNLRGVLTAITPVGDFLGGELVLPRWAVAIAFRPGDLLFFDPQQVHGNLPFKGRRISAALYCARHIAIIPAASCSC